MSVQRFDPKNTALRVESPFAVKILGILFAIFFNNALLNQICDSLCESQVLLMKVPGFNCN